MTEGMFGTFGEGTGIGLYMIPAVAILIAITAIMVWPVSKTERWTKYRPPLYVISVLAENWIIVVGLTLILTGPIGVGSPLKAVAFLSAISVFWAFTIILASSKIQGKFIPELGRFRPDLVYPTGANLARGEIFAGLGLKFILTTFPATLATYAWLPVWNWWGLLWAIIAMVFLVAVRGIAKVHIMLRRMLYGQFAGWSGLLIEEGLLFLGFAGLAYGFLNVFMGYVPFTVIVPRFWPGGWYVLASAILLIPIRGWIKLKSDRMTMSYQRTMFLMALLYLGVLLLFYGFIAMFMGKFFGLSSPLGVTIGLVLQIFAISLLVWGRTKSIMNDRKGMIPQMLYVVAHEEEEKRLKVIRDRLKTFAELSEERRYYYMSLMNEALAELPPKQREIMSKTRVSALATSTPEVQRKIMKTMDRIMFGM